MMNFYDIPVAVPHPVRVQKIENTDREPARFLWFELDFLVSGDAQIRIDGHVFPLRENSVCILPPDTLHSLRCRGVLYRIWLQPKAIDAFLAQTDDSLFTRFLLEAAVTGSHAGLLFCRLIGGGAEESLLSLMESMYAESFCPDACTDAILLHQTSILLYRLLRADRDSSLFQTSGTENSPESSARRRDAAVIFRYLLQNYATASLQKLADQLNYSLSYCSHFVLCSTGMPFKQLQKKIRMREAVYCLLHTDWKIGEIAEHVGYNSGENFMKLFKSEFGLTPSQYRTSFHTSSEMEPPSHAPSDTEPASHAPSETEMPSHAPSEAELPSHTLSEAELPSHTPSKAEPSVDASPDSSPILLPGASSASS